MYIPKPVGPTKFGIAPEAVARDIDCLLWSTRLSAVLRYFDQRFWENESHKSRLAAAIEPNPRLESVAEHSWHVTDTVLLLCDHFEDIDPYHCLAIATLHDKLEILTGDLSPIGRDGTGDRTHAFSAEARERKTRLEREALSLYLSRLSDASRARHRALLEECIAGTSPDARFVKAVDKLQALAFVMLKKQGSFEDQHVAFTSKYSAKCVEYYPGLRQHYVELSNRWLQTIAATRGVQLSELKTWLEHI